MRLIRAKSHWYAVGRRVEHDAIAMNPTPDWAPTIQLALHAGEKAIGPRVIVPTPFAASSNELSQLVALFNYSSPCGAPRGQKTPFHHDQASHQLSH